MSDFRITPIEILVVLICLGLISVLILPALLISREESRSVTCQSHQVKLVLAIREPNDPLSVLDLTNWPQLLASRLSDGAIIEHCPSDDRQPPAAASYGINPQIVAFNDEDASRISFLDFDDMVVNLMEQQLIGHWNQSVAPRHFDLVNVVFYDSHVEMKEVAEISPGTTNRLSRLWLSGSVAGK
ncbi:MAG: hypothetical protein CMJ74_13415 [Planctomycetaceae bacterium]|nr:hypothetical protein [Planctomycetaceae bacterium]